jgi:glutathione-independent formaldehyde dehydrogenase
MASNRGVVYLEPNKVEVHSIEYPKFENPAGKKIEHGVILEVISTNAHARRTLGVLDSVTVSGTKVTGHRRMRSGGNPS